MLCALVLAGASQTSLPQLQLGRDAAPLVDGEAAMAKAKQAGIDVGRVIETVNHHVAPRAGGLSADDPLYPLRLGGACGGTGACTVTTDGEKTVAASFSAAPPPPPPAKPKPPAKVTVCHKGTTIKVLKSQLAKHRKHGDKLGSCKKKPKKVVRKRR